MRKLILLLIAVTVAFSIPVAAKDDKPSPPKDINVPMADRPCIAVMPFDDGSLQRQEWWGSSWDVGKGLSDILITQLMEKNRFRLMERSLIDNVTKEQDFGASGRVNPQTASKIGKIIGADYLIMGKVTEFNWDKKTTGAIIPLGGIGGIGGSSTKARVAIDLRVVDTETAEILGSYTGKADESRGEFAIAHNKIGGLLLDSSDFINTILGQATKKALVGWCDNLCRAQDQNKLTLIAKHKPIMRPDGAVLMFDNGTAISNCGSAKGYAVGDTVEIHRKTKELKDPDTGEVIRVVSDLIATGTITKVDEKSADIVCTPIDASNAPMEGDMVKYIGSPETPPPTPITSEESN